MASSRHEGADDTRKIRTFEDSDVWKFCRALRKELTALARELPRSEAFRLADQMIRAARSVTNNLAEGYGRLHYQENIQFCRQSRGSLYELIDHLIICVDEQHIPNAELERLREQCIRGIQLINGYIRYLKGRKKNSADRTDWATPIPE